MTSAFASADQAVRATAAILPALHASALALMTTRKPSPVAVYLELLAGARASDLTTAAAVGFRTQFNGYYGVRRNAAWREVFYRGFEAMKRRDGTPSDLFEAGLRSLRDQTGRIEASFVSKAVATLRPESPVIDKVLRDRFAALVAAPAFGGGLDEALAYHSWLSAVMDGLVATPEATAWFAVYDACFADVPGAAEVHAVKKLDFLIWGGRAQPA